MLFSYLDPFTGSMILQVLAAGFVGILAFFRPIYHFFFGNKTQNSETDNWDENVNSAADAHDASDAGKSDE